MRTAVLALVAMLSTVAHAEPAKTRGGAEAEAAVPSDPHATTAAYGDWMLVCQKVAGAAVTRLCEVVQMLSSEKRFSQNGGGCPNEGASISRMGRGEALLYRFPSGAWARLTTP